MHRFQPIHNNVLVAPDDATETSPGGIILAPVAQEKPTQGTVLAAGPGDWRQGVFTPTTVKEGDRVLYGRYAAGELKIDGQPLAIMKEDQIFGILS